MLEWYEGRDQVYTVDRLQAEWAPDVQRGEHTTPYIAELEGRPIGYVQLVDVQPNGSWAFDLFLGETDLWGKGLGTEMSCSAIKALLAQGARRIVIDPRVVNKRAVRVYEKVGFRKVKVLPGNEIHEGRAWDCWLMELDFAAFDAYQKIGSSS